MRGRKLKLVADISFSASQIRSIDGKDNSSIACFLCTLNQRLSNLHVTIEVQLHPCFRCYTYNLFQTTCGKCTGYHQRTCITNRLCRNTFSFRMCKTLIGHWGNQNRHPHRHPLDSCFEIDMTHISEHTRTESDTLEGETIRP